VQNAKTTSLNTPARSPQARGRSTGGLTPTREQVELDAGESEPKEGNEP